MSINIASDAEGPMRPVPEVLAVEGRGLEGDRYFSKSGTYSKTEGTGRQVTLIEEESVLALARDYKVEMEPKDVRRNIVTRGVSLNHLVGREFRVGEVVLRGMRLCEPCTHMEAVSGKLARPGLVHRGGLRCDIVRGGLIRVGDHVGGDSR